MSRTYRDALTTETALLEIDVGHIVGNADGVEAALPNALATADTTDVAGLHSHRALVLVDAGDEHSPTLRTLLAQFDDMTRTSLHTSTTRGALLIVDLGNARRFVHVDGIKTTGGLAVATSQTTIAAGRLTGTTGIHRGTSAQAGILNDLLTMLTGAVTSHDSDHRLGIGYGQSQQVGYLSHRLGTTYRTRQSVDTAGIGAFHQSVGHAATTRETASATVSTRQELSHLSDTRILIDGKFPGGCKEHDGGDQTDGSQNNDCNQHVIHKDLILLLLLYIYSR